jgi:hypothetical protein
MWRLEAVVAPAVPQKASAKGLLGGAFPCTILL